MLRTFSIKNLSVFSEAKLHFSPGLNVLIGENGCGKSHLLKTAYAVMAASAEEGRKPGGESPSKTTLQKILADKLIHVLRPESLGRIARRKQGKERCELSFSFADKALDCAFHFSTSSRSEVQLTKLPKIWQDKAPVFLPTRELMTLYPNFVSVYENHYLELEESWRDTCILLGALALKGPREKKVAELLAPLEKAMDGKVLLDQNGRFYLQRTGQGRIEMSLVAEGLRKLAMVSRLIATGTLLDKGCLFWDEPEASLNPRLIRLVAEVMISLAENGIQIFVATHSLFLLKELEVLSRQQKTLFPPHRYFALSLKDNEVTVEQGESLDALQTLVLLDEELAQSDRFMEVEA
ncbi:AAA15 family ATPase/GTPase [Desulfobotulus alkaliphilus]|uniref:AAA15 family ATPase/GTPase n=1 Tax=Desulfobotulus alkaliphilus TaxID=622671 RepID=A0A562S7S0_9BACT|nr:ATP-binding protein [Desulfobotulus alkaliphilus]TWI76744.1 AAA15 family ATPase/GTPase [Desulfobotulus alkaliphilus]